MKTFATTVLVLIGALCCSSAKAIDSSPYFGRYLPGNADYNALAIMLTNPGNGLSWAMSMRGKKVGKGECTDLVSMYLAYSTAVGGNFKDYRNYIWGGIPNGVRAGDIIQFEYCKFQWKSGNTTYYVNMDHHTAIIASVSGTTVKLLHQNAPIGGPVKLQTLNLSTKTQGTFRFWRPVRF